MALHESDRQPFQIFQCPFCFCDRPEHEKPRNGGFVKCQFSGANNVPLGNQENLDLRFLSGNHIEIGLKFWQNLGQQVTPCRFGHTFGPSDGIHRKANQKVTHQGWNFFRVRLHIGLGFRRQIAIVDFRFYFLDHMTHR